MQNMDEKLIIYLLKHINLQTYKTVYKICMIWYYATKPELKKNMDKPWSKFLFPSQSPAHRTQSGTWMFCGQSCISPFTVRQPTWWLRCPWLGHLSGHTGAPPAESHTAVSRVAAKHFCPPWLKEKMLFWSKRHCRENNSAGKKMKKKHLIAAMMELCIWMSQVIQSEQMSAHTP